MVAALLENPKTSQKGQVTSRATRLTHSRVLPVLWGIQLGSAPNWNE